ncbi:MAG: acetyltransferase [Candidatus Paceibacterota bacterium]
MSEKKSKEIIIMGTGPFAEVAHYYFKNDSNFSPVVFCANQNYILPENNQLLGLPVLPFETIENVYPPSKYSMFVAVGYSKMNKVREKCCLTARQKGYGLVTYLSSQAHIAKDLEIGDNCFILEDNTIQPFVKIGNNVILWSGNHIGHHVTIDDNNFISSHVVVAGSAKIGRNCFLGINSNIREAAIIGKENLIGAGALIMKDTQDFEVYITPRTKPDVRKSFEMDF